MHEQINGSSLMHTVRKHLLMVYVGTELHCTYRHFELVVWIQKTGVLTCLRIFIKSWQFVNPVLCRTFFGLQHTYSSLDITSDLRVRNTELIRSVVGIYAILNVWIFHLPTVFCNCICNVHDNVAVSIYDRWPDVCWVFSLPPRRLY
jgi:hypothetical protein